MPRPFSLPFLKCHPVVVGILGIVANGISFCRWQMQRCMRLCSVVIRNKFTVFQQFFKHQKSYIEGHFILGGRQLPMSALDQRSKESTRANCPLVEVTLHKTDHRMLADLRCERFRERRLIGIQWLRQIFRGALSCRHL